MVFTPSEDNSQTQQNNAKHILTESKMIGMQTYKHTHERTGLVKLLLLGGSLCIQKVICFTAIIAHTVFVHTVSSPHVLLSLMDIEICPLCVKLHV